MNTRVCLNYSVMCYLVWVTCATIFVASTAMDPTTAIFNEDPRDDVLAPNVAIDEEMQQPNLEFQAKLPYWITPVGNRITRLFEKSKESTAEGTILFSTDECSR